MIVFAKKGGDDTFIEVDKSKLGKPNYNRSDRVEGV